MLKHAPFRRGWYFPNACAEKSVMHPQYIRQMYMIVRDALLRKAVSIRWWHNMAVLVRTGPHSIILSEADN